MELGGNDNADGDKYTVFKSTLDMESTKFPDWLHVGRFEGKGKLKYNSCTFGLSKGEFGNAIFLRKLILMEG